MSGAAIRVDGISKRYRIGAGAAPYQTLREAAARAVRSPLRRLWRLRRDEADERHTVWALRDVSFEVAHGEVLGIIGRNGAGKSTLLKILSRITPPTAGRAVVQGRVGSLLEVGTGFHPELTGRDNIYLNGAILGMDRRTIARRFDEIVEFAGVQRFLDTPVKRYSSGMYLRLAFAVAAHLEPDVLVVDEVLAVGDAEFQKKCIGRMSEVARDGRTVLFVSHNMAAIQNLCTAALLLRAGTIEQRGAVAAVVASYLATAAQSAATSLAERRDRQGSGQLVFESVTLQNARGESVHSFAAGEHARLVLHCRNRTERPLSGVRIAVGVDNASGHRITVLSSELAGDGLPALPAGAARVNVDIERLPLAPGRYGYTLFATTDEGLCDWVQDAGSFDVEGGDFFGTGRLPPAAQGDFLVACRFGRGE